MIMRLSAASRVLVAAVLVLDGSSADAVQTTTTPAIRVRARTASTRDTASDTAIQTTRISVTSVGDQLGGESTLPTITPDGRYVAFLFNTNSLALHDNQTRETRALGTVTGHPAFTRDGRFLLYHDPSAMSVAYDMATGTTRSLGLNAVTVSDDLRFATFYGTVPVPPYNYIPAYVRDRQTGTDTQILIPDSVDWQDVGSPTLSPTGRYVAFSHQRVPPFFLGRTTEAYVWDRSTGIVTQVNTQPPGGAGRFAYPVAFTRDEHSLLIGVFCFCNNPTQVFVDLTTGTQTPMSLAPASQLALSANGRFLSYVDGTPTHAYVHDLIIAETRQVDVNADGSSGNADAFGPVADDTGRAAFASNASNLVAGDTNGSSDVFFATIASAPPPAPRNLSAAVSSAGVAGSRVTLSWLAPAAGAWTGYVIEAGSGPNLADLASISTNSLATTFSTLVAGAGVFFVRVRASNGTTAGEPSNEIVVTVATNPSDRPSAPSNLTASVSNSAVTLTWLPPGGGSAPTEYIIQAGSSPTLANLANFATGSAATSYTATGVGAGTYFVRVLASNAAGVGPPSNEVVITIASVQPCSAPPGQPSSFVAFATGSTVTLQWGASAGSPTSYVIEAGSQSGLADVATFDTGSVATSLSVPGVGANTYFVRVRAKNPCGVSLPSRESAVTVR
ncbi:MAG TPA: fibronectin type III domain-containing protein [Vicinamibacterales bacterium]|nr:fibronectin type III domain-containing protein [Vicinamibacterales bacterium]